jgi:hypothetical protein
LSWRSSQRVDEVLRRLAVFTRVRFASPRPEGPLPEFRAMPFLFAISKIRTYLSCAG